MFQVRRSITTLAGMQFAALKHSLSMPHNPYSPLTVWIMKRLQESGGQDIHAFLHEWYSLPQEQKTEYIQKSEKISMEYYQCLAVCINDRQRIAKEIVLKHSEPSFQRLTNEQQAFLDSLPVYKQNTEPTHYFERVSRYVNGINIKEIDHDN